MVLHKEGAKISVQEYQLGDNSVPYATYEHKVVDKTSYDIHLNHDYAMIMGEFTSEIVWHSMYNNSYIENK